MRSYLLSLLSIFLLVGTTMAQKTYVGPETCLQCHTGVIASDKTSWRNTLHANGYSAVIDTAFTMVTEKGIVADYDQNGVDDFVDGLNFNDISSAFDQYKPNAPILAYSDATGYTITIGEVTSRVYLTYGGSGMWKQRFALKLNTSEGETKDVYISPIQFNEATHEYVTYHASSWYDGSNMPIYTSATTLAEAAGNSRSLAKGCSGCHATGLTLDQTTNGEWVAHPAGVSDESLYDGNPSYFDLDGDGSLDQINTGCERCHGPGSEHVNNPSDSTLIINPGTFTPTEATNLCGMCHSRGVSKPNGTFHFAYNDDAMTSWTPGDMVADYYTDGGGYWGDVNDSTEFHSSKKHHQQFRDFEQSAKANFVYHQVTCYECHDPHGSANEHMIVEEVEEEDANGDPIIIPTEPDNNTLCLSCHATHGPFADISKEMVADYANNITAIGTTVTAHTHHPYDPEGNASSRCTKCHMPKTAKSAIEYDIHSHTFEPIPPQKTKLYAMPNACAVSCHRKTTYPNFNIAGMDLDKIGDWTEATDLALADTLMHYYGPNGIWWQYSVTALSVAGEGRPTQFQLAQNYPNPFNPATSIRFDIPKATHVTLTIFDITGQKVKTLLDHELVPAGTRVVKFEPYNLASGVYFYRLETDKYVSSKKMTFLK